MKADLTRMDLGIFGMPRTGSTALTALFNDPPRQIMVNESQPGKITERVLRRVESDVPLKWGVKQVNYRKIRGTMDMFGVKKIIIPIRDIRHIMASYVDALEKQGYPWPNLRRTYTNVVRWSKETVRLVNRMLDERPDDVGVLRYERWARNPAVLEEVAGWAGWSLSGDVRNLSKGLRFRGVEVERHGGKITSRSVELRKTQEKDKWPDWAHKACQTYQEFFGYA